MPDTNWPQVIALVISVPAIAVLGPIAIFDCAAKWWRSKRG